MPFAFGFQTIFLANFRKNDFILASSQNFTERKRDAKDPAKLWLMAKVKKLIFDSLILMTF